jgi:dihydrofolate synthase/folylpolyglutamate synthase
MLDEILRTEGYRVGTYTSPHILKYNERIRIGGSPVDDLLIIDAFERIDRVRGNTTLSFFEFGTLAAFDIFSRQNLDVWILEVGLGGRLDAVNLIDADVALISTIHIDHREYLGSTRESIGLEKAGIFRTGHPAVIGDADPPASIRDYAKSLGTSLRLQNLDFFHAADSDVWSWQNSSVSFSDLPLPAIPGKHQLLNASAVLEVLFQIRDKLFVSESSIRFGLQHVKIEGRFQFFEGTPPVFLDVAHNPQAVEILANHLRVNFPNKRIHAVFSVMKDKDIAGIIGNISGLVESWTLAPLTTNRAARPLDLVGLFHEQGIYRVNPVETNAFDAFRDAKLKHGDVDMILVFGSFFLVSEYLEMYSRA